MEGCTPGSTWTNPVARTTPEANVLKRKKTDLNRPQKMTGRTKPMLEKGSQVVRTGVTLQVPLVTHQLAAKMPKRPPMR